MNNPVMGSSTFFLSLVGGTASGLIFLNFSLLNIKGRIFASTKGMERIQAFHTPISNAGIADIVFLPF